MAEGKLSLREQWNRVAGFGFLVFIAAYMLSAWHQLHGVEALCQSTPPGTPLTALPELMMKQGFSYDGPGVEQPKGHYEIAVPAPMAMGDKTCHIYHDGKVVLRAEIR